MQTYQNHTEGSPTGYDPNASGFSPRSELRRKYPRERDGAKNEWHALIHHQGEMYQQILEYEQELKALQTSALSQAHNQKLQEQIQAKEEQLRQKQNDSLLMDMKIAQFKNDLAKQKLDKQTLQHILAESYDRFIREHQNLSNEERQRKLEDELSELEENRKRLESERRRRYVARQEYTDMAHKQLDEFYQKKSDEKEQGRRFRDEYNDLVKRNIQRDIVKEENYRNFYKMTADHQRQLEGLHSQNVLSDYQRRERDLQDKIDRRISDARQKAIEKEDRERRVRENAVSDLRGTLYNQMEHKQSLRDFERDQKQREVELRKKKAEEYQEYLSNMKNQRSMQQRAYKDTLDRQYQEHEELQRANRMTKAEKKINFEDLQAYKVAETNLHSLVPGFQNSKHNFSGSPGLKKVLSTQGFTATKSGGLNNSGNSPFLDGSNNGFQAMNSTLNKRPVAYSPTYQTSPTNILSGQVRRSYPSGVTSSSLLAAKNGLGDQDGDNIFYRPAQSNPLQRQTNSRHKERVTQLDSQPQNIREIRSNPISPNVSQLNQHKNHSMLGDFSGSHNPIVNPMPFNNQNPYISRQLQNIGRTGVQSNSGYLNGVGNAGLLGPQVK